MLLRELAKLSPSQKQNKLSSIVAKAQGPANGQLDYARLEMRQLEDKHGFSTAEMKVAFKEGRIEDDYEIARWLMLARMVRE